MGVSVIKYVEILTLNFGPFRSWAGLLGLRMAPNEKVAYHKSFLKFNFRGVTFMKKCKIPKF